MPERNGTGPKGNGTASGRGFGSCNGARATQDGKGLRLGQGLGNRRGLENSVSDPTISKNQKELLQEQKKQLESRLDILNKQLESL